MQIEKDIPLPKGYRPRTDAGITAQKMVPGDSVLCETEEIARNMRYAIYTHGGKASVRKSSDGWRIWRVA